MIPVEVNTETIPMPETWNELSFEAALIVAGQVISKTTVEGMKLALFCHYSKAADAAVKQAQELDKQGKTLPLVQLSETIYIETQELFNFLFKKVGDMQIVNSELTINRLETFAGLFGPDHFKRLEVWEFALAEKAYENWLETNRVEFINRLMAILYRPARKNLKSLINTPEYDGDPRELFNDQLIDNRILKIRQEVPLHMRYLVLWWFEGCIKQLPQIFKVLYRNTIAEKLDPEAGKIKKPRLSWYDTILKVSQHEHRDADDIARRNLFQFMRERELLILENDEHQRELDKIKAKNKS
ncbi:hypothetical protein [uncultured Draconibacterium sp.]|uniref:hypothetical protein n=1 Tax=uncultured Draconibacterium sp. TaxID=1573823 RepID=UPI0025DF0879|nr:hypothetical protein [uncultured Draconibacterium sp.]